CSAALRPVRDEARAARGKPSVGSALQQHFVHLCAPVEPSHARLLFDQIALKPALHAASRAWARLYNNISFTFALL
ncbi:TPA: hypothetical protein ACKP28_002661, partial [Stenotrophomonas maltophilia]